MENDRKEYLHALIDSLDNSNAITFLIELIEKLNKNGWGF